MREIVRSLARDDDAGIELVAERMRLTLIDVLGRDAGASMYSLDWLRERVRFHLDPGRCTGEVFVVEAAQAVVGHTIVRVDAGDNGAPLGLFSTIYVEPGSRRRGLAAALLAYGEAWLRARGMTTLATNTGARNTPLIALFENHGYAITLSSTDGAMVQLSKSVGDDPPGRVRRDEP